LLFFSFSRPPPPAQFPVVVLFPECTDDGGRYLSKADPVLCSIREEALLLFYMLINNGNKVNKMPNFIRY